MVQVWKKPRNSNTFDESLLTLKMMANALAVMLNGLMSVRYTTEYFVDRHVKIFLSTCNKFARSHYDDRIAPYWVNTQNFPSLLNLTEQIEHHRLLRGFGDGTRERYIQSVKKILKSMRQSLSYFVKKVIMIQKLSVVQWMNNQMPGWNEYKKGSGEVYNQMYFRYNSYDEVL